jgi:hypothetical protein
VQLGALVLLEGPADDAELVTKRILHHGPLEDSLTIRRIQPRRPDHHSSDLLDLPGRAGHIVHTKVEVRACVHADLTGGHELEQDPAVPDLRILGVQDGELTVSPPR